jgi:hypothetical protein
VRKMKAYMFLTCIVKSKNESLKKHVIQHVCGWYMVEWCMESFLYDPSLPFAFYFGTWAIFSLFLCSSCFNEHVFYFFFIAHISFVRITLTKSS